MALDFFTGWDYVASADVPGLGFVAEVSGAVVTGAQSRHGGKSLEVTSNHGITTAGARLYSNAATRVLGFGLRNANHGNNGNTYGVLCSLLDGSGTQVSLAITSSGAIAVFRGIAAGTITNSATGLLGTSSNTLTLNTWLFVELVVTIDGSVGTVEVYVDGSKTGWLDLSSQNTKNTSNAYANGFAFSASTGMDNFIDDLYFLSGSGGVRTTRLGNIRVIALNAVTGNGTNAQSTPSTGSDRGAMVDETTPNGDTDYNSFSAGQVDTYHFPASGSTLALLGVQVKNDGKKTDAGTCEGRGQVYIGGTLYDGDSHSVHIGYDYAASHLWEQSPATGVDWIAAELDAAEFGLKRAS